MASYVYVCVKCLRSLRVVGYVPPDFDNICEECRGRGTEEAQGAGVSKAIMEGSANSRASGRDAVRGAKK